MLRAIIQGNALSISAHRLLGFAFAGADLLLEISASGDIEVAIGASEALSGTHETQLVGRAWRDFIASDDQSMLAALLKGLHPGRRAGPIVVSLSGEGPVARAASLAAFCLPDNRGAVSCALSRANPRARFDLKDRTGFESATAALMDSARATGIDLELALVELGGFANLRTGLSPDAASALEARLSGALRAQSYGGGAATELSPDRYALVRQTGESADELIKRVVGLIDLQDEPRIQASAQAVSLSGEVTPSQVVRAIRYSLDGFIRDGVGGVAPASLTDALNQSLKRTLAEVGTLGQVVSDRRFRLVYQPVVNLKQNAALHHYEVLVRFGDNASPFPMIRMAEELDLIQALDLAVMEQTIAKLVEHPDLTLAANVSGRTIMSSEFVAAVGQLLKKNPKARGRLMVELTESAAIEDLALADRHLVALKALGIPVCLDDFGAGAASLAYLQQLTLDIVKIDGRYIRDLHHGGRETAFIRHLVTMCAELGMKTLAETVETTQAEEAVRRAGVDFAQGWLYGAAADLPVAAPVSPARPAARRMGAVESWG